MNSRSDNTLIIQVQHRNAANAANLASWDYTAFTAATWRVVTQVFAYEFAENERLRIINTIAGGAGVPYVSTIFARLRT